jgi:Ca2+-dependent lipid-binding protein
MPSEIKCIIYAARNLPVMETSRNSTDAYCELRFGKNEIYKTKTIYNNLEPRWEDAIFTYENIDDEEL